MNNYPNLNLKRYVDFYFESEKLLLPSRTKLAQQLQMSPGEIRTLTQLFVECNFLYKTGHGYEIFKTKRNFKKHTKVLENQTYINFSTKYYSISFHKDYFNSILPNFEINTINDLIYALFLFNIHYKVSIHPYIQIVDDIMWYRKECKEFATEVIIFKCDFTQRKNTIKLTNLK